MLAMSGVMATGVTVHNGLQMSLNEDLHSPSRASGDELQRNEDELHILWGYVG